MEKRYFTEIELSLYDGLNGRPAYVACDGIVYDLSGSALWRYGHHQGHHQAGNNLTEMLKDAPHGENFLQIFPTVGVLIEE